MSSGTGALLSEEGGKSSHQNFNFLLLEPGNHYPVQQRNECYITSNGVPAGNFYVREFISERLDKVLQTFKLHGTHEGLKELRDRKKEMKNRKK